MGEKNCRSNQKMQFPDPPRWGCGHNIQSLASPIQNCFLRSISLHYDVVLTKLQFTTDVDFFGRKKKFKTGMFVCVYKYNRALEFAGGYLVSIVSELLHWENFFFGKYKKPITYTL